MLASARARTEFDSTQHIISDGGTSIANDEALITKQNGCCVELQHAEVPSFTLLMHISTRNCHVEATIHEK